MIEEAALLAASLYYLPSTMMSDSRKTTEHPLFSIYGLARLPWRYQGDRYLPWKVPTWVLPRR